MDLSLIQLTANADREELMPSYIS